MSTYREIVGKKIKKVTSDPSDSADGQMWYNSTKGSIRGLAIVSAWVSSASMATARGYGAANGTQTASLYTGGLEPGGTYYANTEEYNGSGWSAGGALPTQNYAAGSCGTQTAALFFGGSNNPGGITVNTYTYNGSSWTATPNSLNSGRDYICGTGTQTSALAYCGRVTSPSLATVTNFEEWNGSSWTALTAAPTAVALSMGSGPETASFFASGGTNNGGSPYLSTTQEYNGSTLSAGGNVNTGRSAGGAAGDSSAGLIFGGDVSGTSQTKTETYDGTSFSEIADMSTAMRGVGNGSGATNAAAVVSGSYGPPALGTTEEFTSSTNVITAAAWSSGGSLNLGRHDGSNSGTKTAGLFAGGKVYPNVFKNESEEYDGTSWSEGNNLGTARMLSGAGTQTAGLAFAGTNGSPGSTGVQALTEEYDGSSWSESGDMSTARMNCGGAGLQTAAYAAGGIGSPNAINDLHEQYDGSSWTSATAMNTERSNMGSVGTTTAGLVFSGYTPPSYTFATTSEEWNGSAWTSGGTVATARYGLGGFGSQTDAIGFAGATPPNNNSAVTEGYDGTAFSSRPSLSTARMQFAPSGSYNSGSDGMAVGGSNAGNPMYANTEEWTPRTETVTAKTLTTS